MLSIIFASLSARHTPFMTRQKLEISRLSLALLNPIEMSGIRNTHTLAVRPLTIIGMIMNGVKAMTPQRIVIICPQSICLSII